MKESQKRAKFCPKCGSPNTTFVIFFKPSIRRCLDCGYEGTFIIEDSKLAEKIRERFADAFEELGVEVPESLGPTPPLYMPLQAES